MGSETASGISHTVPTGQQQAKRAGPELQLAPLGLASFNLVGANENVMSVCLAANLLPPTNWLPARPAQQQANKTCWTGCTWKSQQRAKNETKQIIGRHSLASGRHKAATSPSMSVAP